ncbi:MAG: hypothetical protein AB7Q29_01140 [Vicinamibacterales bacterium]
MSPLDGRSTANRRRLGPVMTAAAVILCVMALVSINRPAAAASPALDEAIAAFLAADTPEAAGRLGQRVLDTRAGFDEVFAALEKGRRYSGDVPRGVVKTSHVMRGVEFPYTVDVPDAYDPARRYALRVQLHGGVGRPDATPRGNGIGALAGAEQIYLLPTAWADAEWWSDPQLENLRVLVDRVKRTYNVDENRVVLSGVSDGGTGTYYYSMRETTPFAAFLPLNGAIAVLRNATMRVDGGLFMQNMVNKPFFIVNGGKDPLYPTTLVEPYIEQMRKGGVEVTYLPQPEAGHNTSWWPAVKDTYERFVQEHPRRPLPDTLSWQSDLRAGTGRAHWLVIDELAPARTDAADLPDLNDRVGPPALDFGITVNGARVTSVVAGSNADSFGLLPGDLVTKVGERVAPAAMDVTLLFTLIDTGSPMVLTVSRGSETLQLSGVFAPTLLPRRTPYFVHARPSGRVDLVRSGNTVTATTRGVGRFTLLLSPRQFDFSKPVKVVADGRTVFEGSVKKDVATLLEWAARDNDRTMLFAAKLTIRLDP